MFLTHIYFLCIILPIHLGLSLRKPVTDTPWHVPGLSLSKPVTVIISQNDSALEPELSLLYSHRDLAHVKGAWTLFPLTTWFVEVLGSSEVDWLCIATDRTAVNPAPLERLSQLFPPTQEHFLGYPLQDEEPSIIHHFFDDENFSYPLLAAGVCISKALVRRIASKWEAAVMQQYFSIDPPHELARLILDLGVRLTPEPFLFCSNAQSSCVFWARPTSPCPKAPLDTSEVLFGVKTCKKFHRERVPVVKSTWARADLRLLYYSDAEDSSIPTVVLPVEHATRGFCDKTTGILRHAASQRMAAKWLVIADDDTLLSVPRLLQLLSCHDASKPVVLGERYGYLAALDHGYSYPTGGAGMVFSWPAVRALAAHCHCPQPDSPDDMVLGSCLPHLDIPLVHVPLLHQARPQDYHKEVLAQNAHVSFHKFWMTDPLQTYLTWLADGPRHMEL